MDALGLVTLLGADQVSTAIGSLQRRRYTGALPLLAAFVLAGDRFSSTQPGFTLYEVTDGRKTANMAGWFTRSLMCQRINNSTTVFEWKRREAAPDPWRTKMIAMVVSCLLVTPLIICTGLMGDWYGVANAGAIVVSIATRLYILERQRWERDLFMKPQNAYHQGTPKTCIVIRSDGKMVTIQTPTYVLGTILRQTEPLIDQSFLSGLAQQAAWLALGTHLLVLGMCTLVTRIYTVVLLMSSTVAISSIVDWSADTQHKTTTPRHDLLNEMITTIPFNDDWDVIKIDPVRHDHTVGGYRILDKRQVTWAKLGLNRQQELQMVSWRLFPEIDKQLVWWEKYRALRDDFAAARRQNTNTCSPPPSSDIALQDMRPPPQPSSSPVN
jgi:hypothetical protein